MTQHVCDRFPLPKDVVSDDGWTKEEIQAFAEGCEQAAVDLHFVREDFIDALMKAGFVLSSETEKKIRPVMEEIRELSAPEIVVVLRGLVERLNELREEKL